jgi:hypothetical protein
MNFSTTRSLRLLENTEVESKIIGAAIDVKYLKS